MHRKGLPLRWLRINQTETDTICLTPILGVSKRLKKEWYRLQGRLCAIVCLQWTIAAIDHKENYHVTNRNTQT